VDEGDIVKSIGDYLVGASPRPAVLDPDRRRTHCVRSPCVDAFGPGIDPAWLVVHDMLVSRRRIVVVGYSYERGGTELGLFDLLRDGRIRYRATITSARTTTTRRATTRAG
jgi:hypothetical protein